MKKQRLLTPASAIDRRTFLGASAAAGIAAGLGGGLLPGMARAQPKRGGTFRAAIGAGTTTDNLDPGTWANEFTIAQAHGYNSFLTGVRRDGTLEGLVAESWEPTPDAAQWRFKIRSGIEFHSGKTLTPEDVVASIRYHMGENTTSAAKPLLESVTDIRIDGDTVVFDLESGSADFPFTFTDYHLAIMPAADGTIDWRSGDGCGPYRLTEFDPGVSSRFVKNENDFIADRGFFDEIEMVAVVDVNARTTALVSGDVNFADRLDLKTVGLLSRNPAIAIHSVPGNQHYVFPMLTNREPFTDNSIRLALKYAVNRQEMVDKILFGYGSLGNDHPIGRGQRFFNDELAQTEYDPDRARFHLREAGLDSLEVELSAADAAFAGAVDAAVLYQASAGAAGITIKVNRVPNDGYWSDVWMQHPWAASYWGGRPTEDAMFTTAYASGAAWNDTYWENERFNELLVQARAELDEAKRRDMYFEMQKIVNEDGGAVIPMFANYVFATGAGVSVNGDQLSSHWANDGHRWFERWSFA